METANSQHQHRYQHRYQQHPMVEELLALFQQETASCYQPADYLAYLTVAATATVAVSAVAKKTTETVGPHDVCTEDTDTFMVDAHAVDVDAVSSAVARRRRQAYVTMRQKMGEWAYDVIDHYGMSREAGALAMNYTDRYLQAVRNQRQLLQDHHQEEEEVPTGRFYQLIVMTSLFLAMKLSIGSYASDILDARTMCAMSRGMFTRDKLLSMERDLLHTLQWRMHPPTPKVFLYHYLELLAHHDDIRAVWQTLDKKQWHAVRNEADFMLEHAVLDYHFCGHFSSVIAVAALCNTTSVGFWPIHVDFGSKNNNPCLALLKQIMGMEHAWDEGQVADCRQRLHDLMVHYHSQQATAAAGQLDRLEQSSETADQQHKLRIQSPVSVVVEVNPTTTKNKTTATPTAATRHPS